MVDTREIMEKLEHERLQQRKNKIRGFLKMTFKDLDRLIKIFLNSGVGLNIKLSEAMKYFK